jgi:hypothetical protein
MKNNLLYPIVIASVIALVVIATPFSTYAQQQKQPKNFVANLTGKNMVSPVDTAATGIARFHVNSNGTLCYYVDVKNITGVLAANIGFKNGTDLEPLLNPYAEVATISSYPTGPVDGILGSGEIKAGIRGPIEPPFSETGLSGPLLGKNVTNLVNVIKSGDAYVTVRTTGHESGEIQGQILPSNSHVGCLTSMRFAYPPPTTPSPSNFGP